MKLNAKSSAVLTAVLLCAALLCSACGAGGGTGGSSGSLSVPKDAARDSAPQYAGNMNEETYIGEAMGESAAPSDGSANAGAVLPAKPGGATQSGKIIYSAEANIETVNFDSTIEEIYAMLDTYGAFIETSYVGGRGYADSYAGRKTYRSASFALRVPKESFSAMTDSLSDIGNLLSFSSKAENISAQYTDAESRLKAYRTEESRLLDMLSAVNDVESLIAFESRLSDVRYEIESLTSRIRDWQNQIDYSPVYLYINEVEQLQEQTKLDRSYAQELGDGFSATLRGIGSFFREAFRLAVAALPVIFLLAVIAAAAAVIAKNVRAYLKKRAAWRHGDCPADDGSNNGNGGGDGGDGS
jgi:hypothetical protein